MFRPDNYTDYDLLYPQGDFFYHAQIYWSADTGFYKAEVTAKPVVKGQSALEALAYALGHTSEHIYLTIGDDYITVSGAITAINEHLGQQPVLFTSYDGNRNVDYSR